MTDPTQSSAPHAGAPFGAMLRGALLPSVLAGLLTVAALVGVRGTDALAGALIGLVVSIGFFASGMFLLSRLVRDASPHKGRVAYVPIPRAPVEAARAHPEERL